MTEPVVTPSLSLAPEVERSEMRIESFTEICVRHATVGIRSNPGASARDRDMQGSYAAAGLAVRELLWADGFPADAAHEFNWHRDALGKPFVRWTGNIANWAAANGRDDRHLHISNTHDGGADLVIAAYSEDLVGIGIDAVWLPRLRLPGKNAAYLRRFARQFMSPEEWSAFENGDDTTFDPLLGTNTLALIGSPNQPRALPAPSTIENPESKLEHDPDEPLRLRVAAHFSLMEAASKACGTGLKIGAGMGRDTSLPKQSLGASRVAPDVALLFQSEALPRLDTLGARRYEASVRANSEFLVSVVALYRSEREKSGTEAGGTQEET
jgi:phosphopantetheinyl transferase (holo-ACP synthase)